MRNAMWSTLALGAAILVALAGTSPGFAKAHDNGVSNVNNEGTPAAGGRGSQKDDAPSIGMGGIGDAVNEGKRGDGASSNGSDNGRAGGVSEVK